MDKSWMTKPRYSIEYLKGVDSFLNFALSHDPNKEMLVCPCNWCDNTLYQSRDVMRNHLVCKGVIDTCTEWDRHGEIIVNRHASPHITTSDPLEDQFNMNDLVRDAFGVHATSSSVNEALDVEENNQENFDDNGHVDMNIEFRNQSDNEPNEEIAILFTFLEEGNQELYPGSKSTVLSFTVQPMHLKCDNKWTEKLIDNLLQFLKIHYPESRLPKSCYEAKKMTKELGLSYEKIHVCPNNCTLFRGVRESQEFCHICNASRWQQDNEVSEGCKKKKFAAKFLRYFPLIPRLQRLYMSSKTSSSMRWHGEGRTNDGILIHPADSCSWKDFDCRYPEFASDIRNIRFGLASDGFNPFGLMSNAYSMWPVVLIPYNLPPWMCMKQSSFILSMIIPGKESPGNKIDIFLEPLIDELLQLWEGVQTYDATSKTNFRMHAALMWTINDFPAYASLSGWSTKGIYACPCCADKTQSRWLKNGGKFCYLGHRRWLSASHKFCTQKYFFDGTEEHEEAQKTLTGSDALI